MSRIRCCLILCEGCFGYTLIEQSSNPTVVSLGGASTVELCHDQGPLLSLRTLREESDSDRE